MALPLDMPDNYQWLPGSGRSQMNDLGELAVRMGSPVIYDRRGSVYLVDRFDYGFVGSATQSSGAGSAVAITTEYGLHGGYSVKLTGGSTLALSAELVKYLNPSVLTGYGIEVTFSIGAQVSTFDSLFQWYTGALRYRAEIRYDMVNSRLQYYSASSGYVTIATIPVSANNPYLFHTMKHIFDLETFTYVRAQFDQQEFDLSGLALNSIVSTSANSIETRWKVTSVSGQNGIIYIDNVIATIGEQ